MMSRETTACARTVLAAQFLPQLLSGASERILKAVTYLIQMLQEDGKLDDM